MYENYFGTNMPSKPRNKSPQLLEAQLGDFLLNGERINGFSYENLWDTARLLLELEDKKYDDLLVGKNDSGSTDYDNLKSGYLAHLRSRGAKRRDLYSKKADLFSTYDEEFSDELVDFGEKVGQGYFSDVFKKTINGQDYAIRVPYRDKGWSTAQVDKHLDALLRVQGLDNIEQIVAASYVDDLTVSRFAEGETLFMHEPSALTNLSQDALNELFASLMEAESRGVVFDSTGQKNLLYDETTDTLTMVDIGIPRADSPEGTAAQGVVANLKAVSSPLVASANPEYAQAARNIYEKFYTTLETFDPSSPVIAEVDITLRRLNSYR